MIVSRFIVLVRSAGTPVRTGNRSVRLPASFNPRALASALHILRQRTVEMNGRSLLVSTQAVAYRPMTYERTRLLCPVCYARAEDHGLASSRTHVALLDQHLHRTTSCAQCHESIQRGE